MLFSHANFCHSAEVLEGKLLQIFMLSHDFIYLFILLFDGYSKWEIKLKNSYNKIHPQTLDDLHACGKIYEDHEETEKREKFFN